MKHGYVRAAALTPVIRVADCEYNTQQVLELAKYGVGAATVAPDVIRNFVNNVAVDSAVDAFVKDFNATYGDGKTMLK